MKKFVISPGIHNSVEQQFKPVMVEAKTWMKAVNKALEEKSIPKDAYSIQVLEISDDDDEEEESDLLALHFKEMREDRLLDRYLSSFQWWML